MPFYIYSEFQNACGTDKNDVIPINNLLKDANDHFNLPTRQSLLDFIFNDGLENLDFLNTKEWENNPDQSTQVMVDAYEFTSLSKLGYIAFMFINKTSKWLIKSFHPSENRNPIMSLALKEAGLIELKGENDE